jgi:hypothetical protein
MNKKPAGTLLVIIVAILLPVFLFSISGCRIAPDNNTIPTEKYYNTGQVYGFASEDGFYHSNREGFLYFFDFISKQNAIVCNKINCTHKVWYEDTPDEQRCNAYIADVPSGFTFQDNLYILKGDLHTQIISIEKSGLDRTKCTEIAKVEGNIVYPFVVKDQFLYMSAHFGIRKKDEDGMEIPTGEFESWLYKVDLRTGATINLTNKERRFNGGMFITGVYGNNIYCMDDYFENKYDGTNYIEAKRRTDWYSFDILSGQLEAVFTDNSFEKMHVYNNILVGTSGIGPPKEGIPYEFSQYQITVWDVDAERNIAVFDVSSYLSCVDGKVFYTVAGEEDQKYYYFDINREIVVDISREFMERIHVREAVGDYLYVLLDDPVTSISSPCLILKSDFYSEKDSFIYLM